MPDKKVFDVAHPQQKEVATPAAKPARKIMLAEPILPEPGTSATPDIEEVAKKAEASIVSRQAAAIAPPEPEVKEEKAEPVEPETAPEVASKAVEPETEVAVEEEKPSEPAPTEDANPPALVEPKEVAESAPEEPVAEIAAPSEPEKVEPIKELSAIDSLLPDDSQRATAIAKDTMQSPTMYDTKAYYVPIGKGKHRHGHAIGTVIAGVATALIAAAVVYYFVKLA